MKKDKKMNEQTLGGRLKGYEKEYENEVEPEKHIIVRIDGHHFSKYTKGLQKPFDKILSDTMVQVTAELVERFNAYTGYTQSDEISLFIPSLKDVTVDNRKKPTHKIHKRVRDDWTHGFGGRVQKMSSLIASFTTMRFNHWFTLFAQKAWDNSQEEEWHKYCARLDEKAGNAYFDARIYGVDDTDEVFNSFMWRVRDAEKNSRSMFAQTYCSHKQLQGLSGEEQVAYCKDNTGQDWETIEDKYKYGVFVKKELYTKFIRGEDISRFVDTQQAVTRSRITTFSEKLTSYSDDGVDMILSQYKKEPKEVGEAS